MAHEIRHTFVCDICGFEYPRPDSPVSYKVALSSEYQVDSYSSRIPCGFNFIQGKLICYKHRIIVEHNGDVVTVKEAEANE